MRGSHACRSRQAASGNKQVHSACKEQHREITMRTCRDEQERNCNPPNLPHRKCPLHPQVSRLAPASRQDIAECAPVTSRRFYLLFTTAAELRCGSIWGQLFWFGASQDPSMMVQIQQTCSVSGRPRSFVAMPELTNNLKMNSLKKEYAQRGPV